jgi:hypothetical protein
MMHENVPTKNQKLQNLLLLFKVKFTLYPTIKAQKDSKGTAPSFLNLGAGLEFDG